MARGGNSDPRRAGLMTSKKIPLAWPAISPSERELAVVMRNAWSTHRLSDIQRIVETVVTELEPGPLEEPAALALSPLGTDALTLIAQEAVTTCSQELRRGCGLPTQVEASEEPERSRSQRSVQAYEVALASVRSAAVVALEASFAGATLALQTAQTAPPSSGPE